MRSRRVWRLEKPFAQLARSVGRSKNKTDDLCFWREELEGEIVGIVWERSDLVRDLLHVIDFDLWSRGEVVWLSSCCFSTYSMDSEVLLSLCL